MKIRFLGTGSISSLSNPSAFLINDNFLIDCGNGIHKALLRNDVNLKKIKYILITHLHGDHIFDIPFLLFGINKLNPGQEITFIGNKYLKKKVLTLLKEAHPTTHKKIYNNLNINFIRNDNLNDFNLENIKLSSFKVSHGDLKDSYGYVLDNIAFTGDTSYCDSIKGISKKVDYIITDTTMKIGNHNHMGIDNIKDISNNNPNLKIITTHMGIESKKKLQKTLFKNNNVEIADDNKIIHIKTNN